MRFDDVLKMGRWAAMRDCPGRYTLKDVPPRFSISDVLSSEVPVNEAHSPKAVDTVWIARLEDGGVISYARGDGSWLHTLNTVEGFERTLNQLEIDIHGLGT